MGFDMSISCALSVCQESGRPYFLGINSVKVFDLMKIPEVPQEFRRFLNLHGSIFYEYTRSFGKDETTVDAAVFFERFPPWEEVECEEGETWTSLNHNKFYSAMEWFAHADVNYIVSWSY